MNSAGGKRWSWRGKKGKVIQFPSVTLKSLNFILRSTESHWEPLSPGVGGEMWHNQFHISESAFEWQYGDESEGSGIGGK